MQGILWESGDIVVFCLPCIGIQGYRIKPMDKSEKEQDKNEDFSEKKGNVVSGC